MADRHENNWEPVRPLDDDSPDDRTPDPVPHVPAVVAEAAAVPDSKPAVAREPFRSTPITMPPESKDEQASAPRQLTPAPVAGSTTPVGESTAASAPIEFGDGADTSSGSDADADEVAAVLEETAVLEQRGVTVLPPEVPAAPPAQAAPIARRPAQGPIQSPPVPSVPPPNQQRVPRNHEVPQQAWLSSQERVRSRGNPPDQWASRIAPSNPQASAVRPIMQPASAHDLGDSLLIRPTNVPPVAGWRRALYVTSGGRIDVGNSAAQQRRLELTAQVDRTLVGSYRVAVLSLKGGVGKTTTTATLGSTFAGIRGDRVIAIDANPDRGTLGQKVPCETTATVRNLLRDIDSLDRYSDVRAYTSQNANRLEVLASDSDPAASEAFSGEDYDRAVELLEKFYSIVITDCGTGLMHSAMESILEGTDTLVVVSSASVDGARSASATLDWLDAHGYRSLVATSVAVVNGVRPRAGKVDLQKVIEHFEQRCAHVRTVPFDPHLEEGAEIELDRLRGRTRTALLEVAAAVAAGFPDSPTASRPVRELPNPTR
ncbi:MinD/ParA family protein [Rhodococcus sp. NPDC078407]|uniref:MinD/ParA family protein n=1 Tax=Rhodococcus sp. NPDC078407 TaxID=3364509 RepID=UPI0037C6003C